jgi:hypothetical protein
MWIGPQLVVVSGLLMGISSTVGFRPQLVVVSGLSVGIPLTVGFRLSGILQLSQSPFTNISFIRWNFGYQWAFLKLSRIILSRDGISAITEPFLNFHEFFFHTMEFRLSRSLSQTFTIFFHMMEFRLSRSLSQTFTNFCFTQWNLQDTRCGGRLYSYILQRVST